MLINLCIKINATGNPGCTLFNSECTISAGNTLRIGPAGRKTASQKCRITKKVKVAHIRLPSIWFRSWSRFFAVSLQVTWVINHAVGCHYFPPGPQLPPQPLRGLLPILRLGELRHDWCEQCITVSFNISHSPNEGLVVIMIKHGQ